MSTDGVVHQLSKIEASIRSHEDMLDEIFSDDDGDGLSTMARRLARERTAATILAALITRGRSVSFGTEICDEAVRLTDALRAALVKP
jgi:hypothetical protein